VTVEIVYNTQRPQLQQLPPLNASILRAGLPTFFPRILLNGAMPYQLCLPVTKSLTILFPPKVNVWIRPQMLAGNFVMEIESSEAIKKNDAITNFVLFCLPKAITEAAAD
jgi:hypothetical protein